MAKQKLSMSEKIRRQLAQGKSVKEISKSLKCSAGLVYAVRSSDKKKDEKVWASGVVATSNKPVKVEPMGMKPYQMVEVPKDYFQPKPTLFQRIKNFLGV